VKRGRQAVLALFLAGVTAGAPAQDSDANDWIRNPAMGNYKAYAEFKMANYASARHIWEVLAGLGNPDALFNLGILAEDGLGEPRDIGKAEALYLAAANAGGTKAQYRLGMLYGSGGAIPRDARKARHYFGLAAASGDREAAARLAAMDEPARPLDDFGQAETYASVGRHAEAAALYRRAAQAGSAAARTRLAWMYEAGRGVERDLAQAARLFMLSAEQGDAEAQYATAVMYRTGKGQPLDRERSVAWLRRAAAQGHPAARAALAAEEAPQ
jgi:TPR repeat protein